jgi:hypothetical protein
MDHGSGTSNTSRARGQWRKEDLNKSCLVPSLKNHIEMLLDDFLNLRNINGTCR